MANVINIEEAKTRLRRRADGMGKLDSVLECESPAEWRRLLREHVQTLRPQNPVELEVVKTIASARWRQRRLRVIETALFDYAIAKRSPDLETELGQCGDAVRLSAAFCWLAHQDDPIDLVLKYHTRLTVQIRRGLAELWQLRRFGPDGTPRVAA